eukprot:GHVT01045945.1.p1 GENE.GHVT01045945.1~~GHVT01045945.1.p1  ORF type:complete len:129 (+),score=7.75 GHVT01045945.1:718-1104(+)
MSPTETTRGASTAVDEIRIGVPRLSGNYAIVKKSEILKHDDLDIYIWGASALSSFLFCTPPLSPSVVNEHSQTSRNWTCGFVFASSFKCRSDETGGYHKVVPVKVPETKAPVHAGSAMALVLQMPWLA